MARRNEGGSVYRRYTKLPDGTKKFTSWAYQLPRNIAAAGERPGKAGYKTKHEAQTALTEALHAAERGAYVRKTDDTLQSYAEDVFLPKEQAHRRPGTYALYRDKLEMYVFPALGREKLQHVTPAALQRLWADLQTGASGRAPLAPRTVRMVYTVVRKLYADAEAQGLVLRNPALASNPPSPKDTEPPEKDAWTKAQLEMFLAYVRASENGRLREPGIIRECRSCGQNLPSSMFQREPRGRDGLKPDCRECVAAKRRGDGTRPETAVQIRVEGDSLYPALVLAARTGMRRGELLGLRWQDVDLDEGLLELRQQYATQDGVDGFAPLKTKRSRRIVPIDPDTVAILRTHRSQQRRRRLMLGELYAADLDLVLCKADGQPIRPAALSRRFSELARESGLPPLTTRRGKPSWPLHGLRHSVGTIGSELDLAGVSQLLGHHSPAFTATQYVHPDIERIRRVQASVS